MKQTPHFKRPVPDPDLCAARQEKEALAFTRPIPLARLVEVLDEMWEGERML